MKKVVFFIILKRFQLFSTMQTHAQACVCWSKYTTIKMFLVLDLNLKCDLSHTLDVSGLKVNFFTITILFTTGFSQFSGMDTVLEQMLRKYTTLLESELSSSNYKDRFALLLSCEEHQMQLDIRNYDMEVRILKIEISLLKMYFWAALSTCMLL